ncbi:MAG: hypothetical protein A2Z04_01155 [Chloroflexi bacterium RBG_16_57_9]|nr:MAG: hypothetical protein A2Z04_01155 [Chloroflexi bacterium RBG_16_57_9]
MAAWLERYRRYLFIALLALAASGAAFIAVRRPAPRPIEVIPPPSPTFSPTATPTTLLVHVTGAVLRPEVYALPEGSRVKQAIEAAGGPAPDADVDRLNLALVVRDGMQVFVPRQGEAAAGAPAGPASGSMPVPGLSAGPININLATVEELDSLPGIGPAIAQRIVEDRTANGSFKKPEDLKRVRGIGDALFNQIKDRIVVR